MEMSSSSEDYVENSAWKEKLDRRKESSTCEKGKTFVSMWCFAVKCVKAKRRTWKT